MEMDNHWIVQGLLIIIGGILALAWKNLVHRVDALEQWRISEHGPEHKIYLLEKDVALIFQKMKG